MARRTKEQKRIDDAVEKAFKEHGHGIQIPIMEIGDVMDAGRKAGEKGENIDEAIKAAFEKHRVKQLEDKMYNPDSWVAALNHGDVIDVYLVADTQQEIQDHIAQTPTNLKADVIICSLKEAKDRGFRYTDPYKP